MQPAEVLYLVGAVILANYFLQWFIPCVRKNARPS
jgi:sphinganine-1-phosphate aldolase